MQEWPEDIYPPYANGPGYVISGAIAKFVMSQHANQSLRVSLPSIDVTYYLLITRIMLFNHSTFFWLCLAAIQDGGCKYGAMGRKVQFYNACEVFSQLEVLPVRLPRELLHGTLSVTKANAMFVGEVGPGSPILLQLQIAGCDLSFTW
jgi:hypothetical protein